MQSILFLQSHDNLVAMLTDNQKEPYVLPVTPACSFCSRVIIKAKKYNCQLYIILATGSQNLGRMNRTLCDVIFWFK